MLTSNKLGEYPNMMKIRGESMDLFLSAFEFQHLLVLFFGVCIGIIVGALPGLTPTMGVALLIPFTFSLTPLDGLILLGGIYCGSVYGGSIPAIMFNVPGAPASVATTFDGYPMAKKGKGRTALELATISSTIGGIFGMMILIFFAPFFANISLQFGPTETFWIALFGVTVIAAISEGSLGKAFIGGGLGIILSCVGISTITGMERFTFGNPSLVGGFHVVSVLIGLFAFPQALKMIKEYRENRKLEGNHPKSTSTIKKSFRLSIKNVKAMSIGSVLGSIIGIIPGAGGNIASIFAYNEAKRFSKHKEKFGKGHPEGVIASESANNAMVGGSLIPLLTLGIPGSPTAAIFLGGLLIHGIWPGKSLFVDHADVVYPFLGAMILAQFGILILGLLSIGYLSKLSNIPAYIISPIILTFCLIGAYATQNSLFDIYSMVFIGLAMFILEKYGFHPAPIALGFILGPSLEQGLLHGIQIGSANGNALLFFLTGAWNIILITLIAGTILYSFWTSRRNKIGKKQATSFQLKNFGSHQGILNIVALLFFIWLLFYTNPMTFEQKIFPLMIIIVMLLLTIIQFLNTILRPTEQKYTKKDFFYYSFILFLSVVCLLTEWIGFYTQIIILMISVPLYIYIENKVVIIKLTRVIMISLLFTAIMYIVFSVVVKVPIPTWFI